MRAVFFWVFLWVFGRELGPSEGINPWTSVHCAVRREISPCTCRMQEQSVRLTKLIAVDCEGMVNFQQVITALQGKFEKTVDIELVISHSTLDDLPQLSFQQLGLTIHKLFLNNNNLSALPESVFSGLSKTEAFGLADNALSHIPQQILKLMPRIRTLDLNGDRIVEISSTDFQGMGSIHALTMKGNCVQLLETNSLPTTIQKLNLSVNKIPSLNGTLRRLLYLEWLLLGSNDIESLDGELPESRPNTKLKWMRADYNRLTKPPRELRHFLALDNLHLGHNMIVSLDGALSTARQLKDVGLEHNSISVLYPDDFLELSQLEKLRLDCNRISHLNGSLLPLKNLRKLNISHNDIVDFNLQEIRGLRKLSLLDVSHNKIRVVSGKFGNSVELEPKVTELRMEYNELRNLYGGLTGFRGLQRVNLSHNLLETITADDVAGLDDLLILDISHNHLTTLDGTAQVVLKSLEELLASHNWMASLETDFYGLPKLCWADFAHNKIARIAAELVDRTQCRYHGVNSTLRIYLQGNPAMCSESALEAIKKLESKNNTEVHGINECPPPPPVIVVSTTQATTTVPTQTTTTTTTASVTVVTTTAESVVAESKAQPASISTTTTVGTTLETTPTSTPLTTATPPVSPLETNIPSPSRTPPVIDSPIVVPPVIEYQNIKKPNIPPALLNSTNETIQHITEALSESTKPDDPSSSAENATVSTTTLQAELQPPAPVQPQTTPLPPTSSSTTPKMTVLEIIISDNSTELTANDLTIPVNLP